MKALVLLIPLAAAFAVEKGDPKTEYFGATDPEVNLGPSQLAAHWGYPYEDHLALTEDGYDLLVIRIPHGRNQSLHPGDTKRPVVFLQHGLEGSAADWVTNLPNQALAFILADAGYDVWMGNFRGNKYSRLHKTFSPSEHSFWQFSWDEMAHYDLPAMIDLALNVSKSDQLYYIGFSLGTTTAFAKFSQDRQFAKKIKKFYALAPMVNVKNIQGPLSWAATFTGTLETLFKVIGLDEFAPNQQIMDLFAKYFCKAPIADCVCSNLLFLIGGPSSDQLNTTRLPVYLAHSPSGTSTRTMIHVGQMVKSGKFQAYDYGSRKENQAHYRQDKPFEYDVTLMETPVAIYNGGQDWLSDTRDVQNLLPQLRSLVDNVYLPDYNDFDFIWGLRASAEIYWPIRNDIKNDFAS